MKRYWPTFRGFPAKPFGYSPTDENRKNLAVEGTDLADAARAAKEFYVEESKGFDFSENSLRLKPEEVESIMLMTAEPESGEPTDLEVGIFDFETLECKGQFGMGMAEWCAGLASDPLGPPPMPEGGLESLIGKGKIK